FRTPAINASGHTAFYARLSGAGVSNLNSEAIFSEGRGGGPKLVARAGNAAPGAPPEASRFGRFQEAFPTINSRGQTAFTARLENNRLAVFSESVNAGLTLQAMTGESFPGAEPGITLRIISDTSPVLNGDGDIAFAANLSNSKTNPSGPRAIFKKRSGEDLQLLAHEGAQAPGLAEGVLFGSQTSGVSINTRGEAAFFAQLNDESIPFSISGTFSEEGGSLSLINRERGAAGGVAYTAGVSHIINDGGYTAFFASGPNGTAIFGGVSSEGRTGVSELLFIGDAAPGFADGTKLRFFNNPSVNVHGQIAVQALLQGSGITAERDEAIFAQDSSGEFQLIISEGGVIDVSEDSDASDIRTVAELMFARLTGNADGRPSGFSDRGELSFYASFTDGTSGIFVSDVVAIPEPTAQVLGLVAGLFALACPRRHFVRLVK
ncbi:MAG: hypothetical protein GXP24_06850, partial [Planctomycetes bacterium]|nr:hypothetical protein [Planctomycetota bacterium]